MSGKSHFTIVEIYREVPRVQIRVIRSWNAQRLFLLWNPRYVRARAILRRATSNRFLSRAMLARAIKDMIDGSFVWISQLIGQLDGKHVGGLHSCRCAGGRPQGRGSRRGYFNYRRWVYFAFGFSTQLSIARVINCSRTSNHLPNMTTMLASSSPSKHPLPENKYDSQDQFMISQQYRIIIRVINHIIVSHVAR